MMKNRVDPELLSALEGFLSLIGGGLNLHDIPATRALLEQMRIATTTQLLPFEGVTSEDRHIPGPAGAPEVTVRVYMPTQKAANLPVMLWMHGGGFVLGDLESGDLALRQAVKAVNCVIVSVEYRLAPEYPFPAPLEDCYAALQWLVSYATELGVDPKRIAVGGASAGGSLAASLALLARDRAEVNLAFQFLILAALDDRNVVQASETVADSLGWT
jgi:acetyl esterase/lipase